MSTESVSLTPSEARVFYPDELSMAEARSRYFERSGFDDSTYFEPRVTLPIPLVGGTMSFPNINARKAAVRVHDLHHVLTGYGTDWIGEAEISSYEIGTGCGGYWAAWALNVTVICFVTPLCLRRSLRAFARGRAAKKSIYREMPKWDDAILQRTIGALREDTAIKDDVTPTAGDAMAFAFVMIAVWALHALPVAVLVTLVMIAL